MRIATGYKKRMLNFKRFATLLLLLLVSVHGHSAEQTQSGVKLDVVYGKADEVDLHLDLAVPEKGDGPFPLIVCIHGGAWRGGSKAGYRPLIKALAEKGYVAAAVEYRFVPKYKFPAQIEDVKCAVRYLRAHAKELKIDSNKVGAIGDSAGGHLSLLLGLMDAKDGLEGSGGNPGQSSKVQAVVNLYGPTDFTAPGPWNPVATGLVADFLGTSDSKSAVAIQASPITYIDKDDPPILTFHGSADPLVPLDQAKRLHEALKKAGVTEQLEIIEGAGHGWQGKDHEHSDRMMLEFFDRYLKAK